MNRPKILLYLHHVELGQRYPISEDVVIGRQMGHILFPKDERLSSQHCRIFQGQDGKLYIRDMGSEHGTVVDGRLLSPEKSYHIKDGTLIAVGGQVFKCVEPQNRPIKKKNKKRSRSRGFDLTWIVALLLAVAIGAFFAQYQKPITPLLKFYANIILREIQVRYQAQKPLPPSPPLESPFEIVYREIEGVYEEYQKIGKDVLGGSMDKKTMASEFRASTIPKFQAVKEKLGVLKPSSELERRRIEANLALVTAVLKQIIAMASFEETKNPKYSAEIDKLTVEVEAANSEAKKVNSQRVPAADN